MNCEHVRMQLSLFVYNELPTTEGESIQQHLDACAACRDELQSLQRVRDLLNRVPGVTAPVVSLPGLFGRIAQRAERRLRRWRWAAVLAFAALTAVAALALVPRLELRVDADQLTVRWVSAPTPEVIPMPPNALVAPVPAATAGRPSPAELDEQLAVLRQIVRTLARDAGKNDDEPRGDSARLEARLTDLERRVELRLREIERDFRTLYRVQFASRDQAERGGKP